MSIVRAETPTTSTQTLSIPSGFKKYFLHGEGLQIVDSKDLLSQLKQIELGNYITELIMYELPAKQDMQRHMVVMEDIHGYKALISIAQDTHGRFCIGGTGVYATPDGQSPATYAQKHTLSLALAMRYKTTMAGLRKSFNLSGMKATVAMEPGQNGLSDWERSSFLQMATGWLFSPQVFARAITGTDARQTGNTIGTMAMGSAFGRPERVTTQICGSRPNFDTPGACRYSLEATLDVLHGLVQTPNFENSTVSIQGFGRIGQTALQLALERGVKHIYLSDVKLPENEELYADFLAFQKAHPGKITLVEPDTIYGKKADIFMPCSSQEGQLNVNTLNKLCRSGVKVILAGANNILAEKNKWALAKLASDLGIVMPPEVLSNCGSVTMGGMERFYHNLRKKDPAYTYISEEEAEIRFKYGVVVPFIRNNAKKRIDELRQIAYERGTDIYTAGEIWYRNQFSKEATTDENGVLQP